MESTKDILNRYGEIMVLTMRNLLAPYSVTGKTVKSIRYTVAPAGDRLTLYGRGYLGATETGRGPRKSNEYGGFDKSMDEYLTLKGFPTKTSKSGIKYYFIGKSWMSAKSLAYKINKEGDKTHKEGGRDIYSGQLKIIQEAMISAIAKDKAKQYLTEITSIFK